MIRLWNFCTEIHHMDLSKLNYIAISLIPALAVARDWRGQDSLTKTVNCKEVTIVLGESR